MFDRSADLYDAIYLRMKDYPAEAAKLADMLRRLAPSARRILDVACGTGEHARLLRAAGFAVDGVDLDAELLARAAAKNPDGRFTCGDMATFDLGGTYDAVLCLFSAIGYVRTPERLGAAMERLAAHARPGGIVLVEPWFAPGVLHEGRIYVDTADDADVRIVRMAYSEVRGRTSITHFRYLVGRPGSIRHEEETHELGLFTPEEMRAAMEGAGLEAAYEEPGLSGRGLWIGRKAAREDAGRDAAAGRRSATERFAVRQGDLVEADVDAIVNAANTRLEPGGGVCGAIHAAAGPELERECRTLPPCPAGEARITGGYRLPARHVIHAVGPVYRGGRDREAELLASAYRESLRLAAEHGLRSIAFPAISTGIFGYPMGDAARVAIPTIRAWLAENDLPERAEVVLFTARDLAVWRAAAGEDA